MTNKPSSVQGESVVPTSAQKLAELLKGVKVNIGLRQQGHMETVVRMRSEGKTWDEIGEAIGWAGKAVEEWYAVELQPIPAPRSPQFVGVDSGSGSDFTARVAAPSSEPEHVWEGIEEANGWCVASCSCGWTYQHPNYGTSQDTFVNHWADHIRAKPPTSTHEGSSPESEDCDPLCYDPLCCVHGVFNRSVCSECDDEDPLNSDRELGSKEGAGTDFDSIERYDEGGMYAPMQRKGKWGDWVRSDDYDALLAAHKSLHSNALKLAEGHIRKEPAYYLNGQKPEPCWYCKECNSDIVRQDVPIPHKPISGSPCPVGIVKGNEPKSPSM